MKKNLFYLSLVVLPCVFFLICCETSSKVLPILGFSDIQNGDTIYHTIPDFAYVDQNGDTVSQKTVAGKIYVTDFFFTHCPTICPKMAQQMLRLHAKYQSNKDFLLLSHSIDAKYDTVATLKKYADKLGVGESHTWHFMHVPADELFDQAKSYLTAVQKDTMESTGFTHSGHFVLVDGQRHVRSFCDGTKPDEVDKLMKDIDILLDEKRH